MEWTVFALQIAPVAILGFAGTAAGAGFLTDLMPGSLLLPLGIVGMLLFVALVTFRDARGWNVALLFGLSLVVGAVLGSDRMLGGHSSWGQALGLALGVLIIAAGLGEIVRQRLVRLGPGLWYVSWIYLAGWIFLSIIKPSEQLQIVWAAVGLLIFGALSIVWFGSLRERQPGEEAESRIPLAIDLYLLGMSVSVIALVFTDVALG